MRHGFVFLVLGSSLAALSPHLVACSSSEAASDRAGSTSSALDAKIKDSLVRAVRVTATCGKRGTGALDPSCAARAVDPSTKTSTEAFETRIRALSHATICASMGSVGQGERLYYFQGVVTGALDDQGRPAGVERVWDLGGGRAATFTYVTGGSSSSFGADDGYAGFASATSDADVASVWQGRKVAAGGSFATPLATQAIGGKSFVDEKSELSGVGGAVPAGPGLADLAVAASISAAGKLDFDGYRAHDKLTRDMTVLASNESVETGGSGTTTAFTDGSVLDAGEATAVSILALSGGVPGAFPAAVAATVLHATSGAGGLDAYCSGAGVATASLHTSSLRPLGGDPSAGGVGELDPFDTTAASSSLASAGGDCAVVQDGCDGLYPGEGLICGASGGGNHCCRKPTDATTVCYSDSDCSGGQICAQVNADPSPSKSYSCIDPADPKLACVGGTKSKPGAPTRSEVRFAAFIPCPAVYSPEGTVFSDGYYVGDNRSFDYTASATASRGVMTAWMDPNSGEGPGSSKKIGTTHSIADKDITGNTGGACYGVRDGAGYVRTDTASDAGLRIQITTPANNLDQIKFTMSIKNPLVRAPSLLVPAIDAEIWVFVDYEIQSDGRKVPTNYRWKGTHDGFPAYELYVNQIRVDSFDPIAVGNGPTSLFPGHSSKWDASRAASSLWD